MEAVNLLLRLPFKIRMSLILNNLVDLIGIEPMTSSMP